MIKRPIQRSVWVLLILNVLVLAVVTLDWRADQVRQMNGSGKGLAIDPAREIMVERPNQTSDLVDKAALAESEPAGSAFFGVASSLEAVVDLQSAIKTCVLLGPFSEDERARIDALKPPGIPADNWVTEEFSASKLVRDGPPEFRVYAGPFETLNAAYQLLKEFRDQGVDSFVMTDGPLAKSVSLGVFSSYGAAERFVKVVPVANQASLAIHSASLSDVISHLQLVDAEIDWIKALQEAGLMAPTVSRKSCPES